MQQDSEFYRSQAREIAIDLAAAEFLLGALRLELFLRRKAGFDPGQPRVPAGSPDGGQWTRLGDSEERTRGRQRSESNTSDRDNTNERRRSARTQDPNFYYVDLEREDRKGGHAYRDHVAKTRQELIAILEQEYRVIRHPNGSITTNYKPAHGSFYSAGDANHYVSVVLRLNFEIVEAVAAGKDRAVVTHRFGHETGIEAVRDNEYSTPRIRPTYAVTVLIVHDPSPNGKGYRILTAYPRNEFPNEVFRP